MSRETQGWESGDLGSADRGWTTKQLPYLVKVPSHLWGLVSPSFRTGDVMKSLLPVEASSIFSFTLLALLRTSREEEDGLPGKV